MAATALRVCVALATLAALGVAAPDGPTAAPAGADLPDSQPCPAACACRYSRIFWETDCARRALVAVPDGLSPDVHALDLSGNRLERLGPFPEGCRLRRLTARENRVRAVAAADLGGLDLLVEVDLSQNQLAEIDPTTFRNASGLFTLNLANNLLEAPAGPLIASESLKNLDLHGNRLRALPGSTFANCSSLAALDLSDNPLGALPAAALAPLTGLETLSVARCGLEALDPVALAPLAQLKTLDASGNALGGAGRWAAALRPLARLDALVLAHAQLEGPLPADAFATCASLRRLALCGNPGLRDPWPAAAALQGLAEMEVCGCGLRELPSGELRANLSSLRLLDASDNALGPVLPPGGLALPALETLRLARCGLAAPPTHAAFQVRQLPHPTHRHGCIP
ncbi:Uncharacterized protein GBIM_08271 [Gryllus bimaculatus]|nr:Uncharacterized protein GBIM_08271 [Gryllus bimaculatus]